MELQVRRVLSLFQIRGHTLRSEVYAAEISQKIHDALSEVYAEFALDHTTVSCWASRFRGGCM